ncbi:MAG: hypothetical protein PVH65_04235 [Chloroflexota bacterium]|jgi:hypothetical protein
MSSVLVHWRLVALMLAALLMAAGCQGQRMSATVGPAEEEGLVVPRAGVPVIDGSIAPGEWEGAAMERFADGSELLLMRGENTLYLAIRAATPEMIAGNVFVNRGDKIEILHVSAALGTAVYKRGAIKWQQEKEFDWCCRQMTDSGAAAAERAAFLADEHWVAVNSRVGRANELEYQIEMMEGSTRLAASILRSSDPEVKTPWPAGLDDDTVKSTPGGLPAELDFRPDEWVTVIVVSG